MAGIVNIALRGLQFFWALLVMALVGNMIHDATAGNPSVVNYDMFCAVFAMLSLLYLIPASIKESFAFHPLIPIVLDGLNTLFWFCAAVATAAKLGVHSCSNSTYLADNSITNGSSDKSKRCHEAQASDAFLFFGFAAFAASLVLSALSGSGSGVNLRGGMGGIRRGGPSMSQV